MTDVMTEYELKDELKNAREAYEDKIYKIKKEFALINNPYRIGDIIEDHYHIIKIETMRPYLTTPPYMMYAGVHLRKDLKPTKNQTYPEMYQTCVVRKIS